MAKHDEYPGNRREGPIRLTVNGASQEALDRGLEAALEVYLAHGLTPSYAAVCHQAVVAFSLDGSLPQPDERIQAAAAAHVEAEDAAMLAAGGSWEAGDSVETSQWPDGRPLWNTLPTLRAWRIKHNSQNLDVDEPEPPTGLD